MSSTSDWRQVGERAAREVRELAYAPYSGFHVGAAIVGEGEVVVGANIENASFGATICAERAAAIAAWSRGIRKWDGLVLVASGDVVPCGICLQVLAELAPNLTLRLINADSNSARETDLAALLPSPFQPDF